MIVEGLAVNQDVIEINNTAAVSKSFEGRFHVSLVYGGRVLQSKRNPQPLVEPPGSDEGS